MTIRFGRLSRAAVVLLALAAAAPDAAAPGQALARDGGADLRAGAALALAEKGQDVKADEKGKDDKADEKDKDVSTTEKHEEKGEDVTTSPAPEEETTTPPLDGSPPAILESIGAAISEELHHARYQGLNALVAFVFGCVMVLDGESVFKWLVIGAVTIVACIMAKNEATVALKLDASSQIGDLVGIEVGALVAWAAYVGIDGVMILVGAVLGGLVAEGARKALVAQGVAFVEDRLFLLVFFTLWVALAIHLFHRKGHLTWLAVLSPALGGALVSSAVSFAVTELATHRLMGWFAARGLHPKGGNWIAFLELLSRGPSPDVGLFVGAAHNPEMLGGRWPLDRILGCVFWLALFAYGATTQLGKDRQRKVAAASPQLHARELSAPLLP